MTTPIAKAPAAHAVGAARRRTSNPGWFLVSPSVALLLLWMIVPLGMTLYFSLIRFNLLYPGENDFVGLENFSFFLTDSGFLPGAWNTVLLVASVLLISVIGGVLIAALLEASEFFGRGIVRVMLISPFFIMPTVGALVFKNLIFHPVSGILAAVWRLFGAQPVDWLATYPLLSIILIVAWQWLPFAILLLMTAMQSQDLEQKEAARLDGAGPLAIFWHLTLPHLARPIAVVVMIETIFLLSVFAEIFTTTNGGPGFASTNLAYLIYNQALVQFDVGMASAGGLIAVVIANIAAIVLVRMIGKNLTDQG
ncbi:MULTISPECIES: carbohydrate ABC transporter permease [unclassified Pseudomonas]|uniref:carbohydrate ABC transporter permease n=1 Tax=unclassified Pseudomonas TaxID=196821 RepID=UPI000BDB0B00|nr:MULTISPECIES: sugar ABC transporter permease [unclassified Pseudomonas]PVZ19995.1 sorbitol/mannitol transport system permease protein [Pseudomonas sp. URIL14HWK12:I12]PVZ27061.1 sorbitol/mannitol transport system permease protein [Pseudomonas sp. URIL14HWK12:I10]PVZ37950.1 sorbitol/mannitol transport system permease protein [Pseudomonas sp. URIL14HWK12:I11]SNZ05018.1 sorbitol ABC transporter membrane protein/mannitol ABC transporter membrane protein [Pseudomonas sp. URIL14HWK12:I9]